MPDINRNPRQRANDQNRQFSCSPGVHILVNFLKGG